MFLWDKVHVRPKNVVSVITGSINQEDIAILNTDTPNSRVPKVKQQMIYLKGETDKSAIIVKNPTSLPQ